MRTYIYADETGNFNFSNQSEASRYFILTTVAVVDHTVENDLLALRRELAWNAEGLAIGFHATDDRRAVRNRVFTALGQHRFRIDATILEKRKARPEIRPTRESFYGFAWYYHLTGLLPALSSDNNELFIIAASTTKAMHQEFHSAVAATAAVAPASIINSGVWTAASSPMIQVADYCAWAIQRKWETTPSDTSHYNLIRDKVASEFDLFQNGAATYY